MTGLGLRIFGATDRGMARSVNEDRFAGAALAPDFGYGVVCDGVGGAKAGIMDACARVFAPILRNAGPA